MRLLSVKKFLVLMMLLVVLTGAVLFMPTARSHATSAATGTAQADPAGDGLLAPAKEPASIIDSLKLQQTLQTYIDAQPATISVYFKYLPSGQTLNLNGDKLYTAASLMKLPLVMQLYRAEELQFLSSQERATVAPEALNSHSGDLWQKGAGYKLSLGEAASLTITRSDNTAANVLFLALQSKGAGGVNVFSALGMTNRDIQQAGPTLAVSPHTYSRFLDCLYGACYLSRHDSQAILSLMTKTDISPLRDGLEPGIAVADKYGIYPSAAGRTSFNDCGIVYRPAGNYSLCIMAEGPTDNVQTYLATISRLVYETLPSVR